MTTPLTEGFNNEEPSSAVDEVDEDCQRRQHDSAICSVLITVIDHIMIKPSPMEPEEYEEMMVFEKEAAASAAAMEAVVAAGAAATSTDTINQNDSTHPFIKISSPINNKSGSMSANNNITSKESQLSTLRVPVLRIFGPIIRRRLDLDNNVNLPVREPSQTACLYVHGAFPYLLARPVIAGMCTE